MDFSQNVDKEFVNSILESSLWQKANVEVKKSEVVSEEANEGEIEVVDEYQDGLANEYDEPTTIDDGDTDYSEDSFTLDDLQYVLDNLEDEDLMEHAMNMLDVLMWLMSSFLRTLMKSMKRMSRKTKRTKTLMSLRRTLKRVTALVPLLIVQQPKRFTRSA
jgi:hypothetical protein